ncbi:Bestrophin, RFP-TM, chloride channel-domain-containing protein [Lobosporangium transversale]|uniref:Bestrophin, RFP-TM, chloride channel-domain-containing protein n=1 Tax=Lobosporangium transversale TaxID=64571 RepID=A0A1Y2GN45_9FUNG|nr:Bestrophin, RFP-TM, chloride channel-domain-containing protein [Lobosporangium transversale]ORZ16170.1 Bestrophin, RFP-TM, chloride channel-domain-containing protein [Lobosporangium transversale]|eukprot:XP_021881517.1 Bestrophin, RFP-TM, chloride channel-domain-containing protein [Lobosporangium transversale]
MYNYFRRPSEYYRRARWSYPDTLRVRGSVIPTVLTDVLIITSFTATIQYVDSLRILPFRLVFPSVIAPALGVVVGLILAFRTNTAYDRFWEGRKLWSALDVQIRNFSRMIWVGMKETRHTPGATPGGASTVSLTAAANSNTPPAASASSNGSTSIGAHLFGRSPKPLPRDPKAPHNGVPDPHGDDHEKVLVIRLLLAYAVAVKHHLRQEFGVRYYDLEYLLPEGFVPCAATDHVEIKVVHDKALGDRHRHYNEDPWTIHSGNDNGQMSLPLEIAYALSLWVISESRAGRIESSLIGNLLGSINSMTDIFTNMERIVFTPIPLAYSIHLRQVVYLYCLALPFTFIELLGWHTVALMALVSFTLFGMEGIGTEIENPFGKDANDLHMDDFCRELKHELEYIVNLRNTVPGAHV